MIVSRTIPILTAILLTAWTPSQALADPVVPGSDGGPEVQSVPATGPAQESAPGDAAANDALQGLRNAKSSAGIESRRNRSASFEVRFGGQFILGNKFELWRQPDYQFEGDEYVVDLGNAGQIQIGVGGGWLFDFRASLTIPTWTVLTEFEFNLVKKGRWVPTVGFGFGFGIYAAFLIKIDAGMEFWILDWLAAYATVGIGLEIRLGPGDCSSCEHDGIGNSVIVAPVTFGLEMRY